MRYRFTILAVVGLVCGLPASADAQLRDNNNGTVTDTRTQLTWVRNVGPGVLNLQGAAAWADALDQGGSSLWRLPTIEELRELYTGSLGSPNGTTLTDYRPFVAQMPPSGLPWAWSSSANSPMQNIALNLATGQSQVYGGGSTLLAMAVKILETDIDNDGIWNEIDLAPETYSNGFGIGAQTGLILDRGDQTVTIKPVAPPQIQIETAPGGGTRRLWVTGCGGQEGELPAGAAVQFSCGSAAIKVLVGSARMSFSTDGWTRAKMTLAENFGVTYYPETRTLTADAMNAAPVTYTVEDGTEYSLQPGESRTAEPTPSVVYIYVTIFAFVIGIAVGLGLCRFRSRRG